MHQRANKVLQPALPLRVMASLAALGAAELGC